MKAAQRIRKQFGAANPARDRFTKNQDELWMGKNLGPTNS